MVRICSSSFFLHGRVVGQKIHLPQGKSLVEVYSTSMMQVHSTFFKGSAGPLHTTRARTHARTHSRTHARHTPHRCQNNTLKIPKIQLAPRSGAAALVLHNMDSISYLINQLTVCPSVRPCVRPRKMFIFRASVLNLSSRGAIVGTLVLYQFLNAPLMVLPLCERPASRLHPQGMGEWSRMVCVTAVSGAAEV
jgi:hypothetical protein